MNTHATSALAAGLAHPSPHQQPPPQPPPHPPPPHPPPPPSPPPHADDDVKPESKWRCTECRAKQTPVRRGGPAGPATLCNACGLRLAKRERANKPRVKKTPSVRAAGVRKNTKRTLRPTATTPAAHQAAAVVHAAASATRQAGELVARSDTTAGATAAAVAAAHLAARAPARVSAARTHARDFAARAVADTQARASAQVKAQVRPQCSVPPPRSVSPHDVATARLQGASSHGPGALPGAPAVGAAVSRTMSPMAGSPQQALLSPPTQTHAIVAQCGVAGGAQHYQHNSEMDVKWMHSPPSAPHQYMSAHDAVQEVYPTQGAVHYQSSAHQDSTVSADHAMGSHMPSAHLHSSGPSSADDAHAGLPASVPRDANTSVASIPTGQSESTAVLSGRSFPMDGIMDAGSFLDKVTEQMSHSPNTASGGSGLSQVTLDGHDAVEAMFGNHSDAASEMPDALGSGRLSLGTLSTFRQDEILPQAFPIENVSGLAQHAKDVLECEVEKLIKLRERQDLFIRRGEIIKAQRDELRVQEEAAYQQHLSVLGEMHSARERTSQLLTEMGRIFGHRTEAADSTVLQV